MNNLRRIRHGEWFIQSRMCRNGVPGYMAWASKKPIDDDIIGALEGEPIYFIFDDTENGAIDKLKVMVDKFGKMKGKWWRKWLKRK